MEDPLTSEGNETPTVGAGDVEEGKASTDHEKASESTEHGTAHGAEAAEEGEKVAGDEDKGEVGEGEPTTEKGELVEGEEGGEAGEAGEGDTEEVAGEHVEGEELEGEYYYIEEEYIEEEILEGEQVEGEHVEGEEKVLGEGEELLGEGLEGEQVEGEEAEKKEELLLEEVVEEEQQYIEEPPPDPTAPYNFSDSKEALKAPFELRPDQLAEVEQLWELYQNYTPAYSDLDGFVTDKELVYMLKSLLLMTFTAEQLQELIGYCCRPTHPKGHVTYDQFLKMVTMRQRDFPIEEELRAAMQTLDPEKTGSVDRDYLKEVLAKQGHKMPSRQLDNLIKEVDMSNDGTIGIEDVVGTMCIDLNKDDLQMLRAAVHPPDSGADYHETHGDEGDDDD